MTELQEIKKKIVSFFKGRSEIAAIYVYGSLVTGGFSEESDVDIGVLFNPGQELPTLQRFDLQADVSDVIGRPVDLVCLSSVSPILAAQVLSKGEKILEPNPHENAKFEMEAIGFYLDLKRIRQPVEANLLKGKIYG